MGNYLIIGVFLAGLCLPFAATAEAAGQEWRQRESSEADDVVMDDLAEEVRFGREVAARLLGRYGLYRNEAIMRYVNLVGRALAQNSSRPELSYRFAVLNTSEINAYAAPGGYVFITKGALEQVHDEAEFAGILAHEMNHITERHVVKELNIRAADESAASGLARLIGGSTESARMAFNHAVDKAMDMLFSSGFKKENEVQADTNTVALCAITGYDPAGLERYFARIGEIKDTATEVLDRTHPGYGERIALLRKVIETEGIEPSKYRRNEQRFAAEIRALQ